MSPPLQLRFVTSAPNVASLPAATAEVAIVGRSNVGKSSLINALANRKKLALTSNTPGRTRMLNLYELEGGGSLVDLPGYGYAAVSGSTRSGWPKMIEGYLLDREALSMIMVLVDGEIGPTKLDVTMLGWARGHELPHTVVATKQDKVKASQRQRRQAELASACQLEIGDIVWVSSVKGTGIPPLRGLVKLWLS